VEGSQAPSVEEGALGHRTRRKGVAIVSVGPQIAERPNAVLGAQGSAWGLVTDLVELRLGRQSWRRLGLSGLVI